MLTNTEFCYNIGQFSAPTRRIIYGRIHFHSIKGWILYPPLTLLLQHLIQEADIKHYIMPN